MKSLLAQEGKLTQKLLKTRNVFANTSYRRFGSAMGAYKLAGYVPPSKTTKLVQTQIRLRLLRQDLYLRLKQLFDKRLRFVSLAGQQLRRIIEIDGSQRVAVYICREINSMKNGERRWLLQLRSLDSHYPMLVCTVDELFSTFLDFYVVPSLRKIVNRYKQFGESKPLSSVSGSKKLGRLEDFIDVAQDVAYRSKNKDLYIAVDDIQLPLDTWMIAHKGREILLGPVGLAIFKMLASNAGQPVARAQLQRAFSKELLDRRNLTCHISSLRRKLGPEVRNRIQTVPGIGYMYVPPPMKNAAICTEVMEKGVP
jgi:DNA-binding winged helix-turn-helix (wHTH) protein